MIKHFAESGHAIFRGTSPLKRGILRKRGGRHLDKHGIGIQITSTSGDNTYVWVVLCRDSNRYVDESRYKDPELSPENLEEADYGNIQETDAKQPTIQSRSQCSSSDDHFPINGRK